MMKPVFLSKTSLLLLTAVLLTLLAGCRQDEEIYIPDRVPVSHPEYTSIEGLYVLNEGNMGSNKATLDYLDYASGTYYRNIFALMNPTQVKEMGDVGNDLGIYGSYLYCVINCSNKIDVLDKYTCVKKFQINIPNCRFIKFYQGYAYVTSYAGPVELRPDYEQRGYVAKIDTATMQVVDTCLVGFQPDELEICDGKIYVANSGGYMFPNYENTVSVIDIATFKEVQRIPIAINLEWCKADQRGVLWINSRGDYYTNPSKLYAYDTRKQRLVDSLDVRVSNMWLDGDSLYIIATEWSYVSMGNSISYALVNTKTHQIESRHFITDGTESDIRIPYGVCVNPITKDIYVADARDYVSPGRLICYSRDGVRKWEVRTGDIPGHFCFLGQNVNEQ